MRKFIYTIVSVFGLMVINSCGLTGNREARVHEFLQQKVASESQGALKLDNFKKVNGDDQNSNGMKTYSLEWLCDISTQQEIWKSGNFLVGYWSDFGVMTKQPNSMDELAMASSSKHFNSGTKIRLGGNALLLKTEQGWRVRELNVKTVQILSEDASNNNTKNNSIASGNQTNVSSNDETANINNTPTANSSSNKLATDLGNGISKFKGAWFQIKYPSSFSARPSLKSTTSEGYSSAFFMSPDKDEEFYIFSPQWNGNATDIDLNSNTERVVSDITQHHKDKIIRYYTYEAKDKGYTRSYQETTESEGAVKWVIGLKYKNQSSYTKYKKQYLAFKSSLTQFAD